MSSDLARDSAPTYAMVDKSRKRKKNDSFPESSQKSLQSDSAIAVADKTKKSRSTPEKNDTDSSNEVSTYYNILTNTKMEESFDSAPVYSILDRAKTSKARGPEEILPKERVRSPSHYCVNNAENRKKEILRKKKQYGVVMICLIIALLLLVAAGLALIIAFMQIAELRLKVALIKSTSPSMATTMHMLSTTNAGISDSSLFANITRLEMSLRAFNEQINDHEKRLSLNFSELVNRLSADITKLDRDAYRQENTTAAKLIKLDNKVNSGLEYISNNIAMQLHLIITNITESSKRTELNVVAAILVDVSNTAGHIFASCVSILQLSPSSLSGKYNIRSSNGSAIDVYCDMFLICGNITGGWISVVDINMTDATNQCPGSLSLQTTPPRTCRTMNTTSATCSSDTFSIAGIEYSNVCGRVIAYQFGSPDAFGGTNRLNANDTLDDNYVDGISLTHGSTPRQHIWTFAGTLNEDDQDSSSKCPCINTATRNDIPPPPFVGVDYFCDVAAATGNADILLFADDPLWDGEGCGPKSTCCNFNNPPWFYKKLPWPTSNDIEMRTCRDQPRSDEDFALEIIQIYVQ